MLQYIKNLFSKKNQQPEEFKLLGLKPDDNAPVDMEWDKIPDPIIIHNGDNLPTILILDDITACDNIHSSDFKNILRLYYKNINKDFNIVKCYGDQCGFIAEKYLNNGGKVDVGILDLTIGNIIKFKHGGFKEIDGVDIAVLIKNKNPNSNYIFTTAHALTMKNNDCSKYFTKLKDKTGEELIDHYYLKQDTCRVDKLYNFLYGA